MVQNIVAGSIRIPLWEYLAGTFLALIPAILAWTVFGDQLMNALDDAARVNYWLVGGALVALAAFIVFSRRWLKQHGF